MNDLLWGWTPSKQGLLLPDSKVIESLPFQESPFLSEPEDSSLCCLEAEGGWGVWRAGLWMGGEQRVPPAWPCLRDGNTLALRSVASVAEELDFPI